jgi:sugar O-acyltransferase (sialic acid O-acetyltransferase NeuD family)
MSESRLVILGAGGHGRVCAEIAATGGNYRSIAFSDDSMERGSRVLEWSVEFRDADLPDRARDAEFVVGVGQTGLGASRQRLFEWLKGHHLRLATLVSPTATVSASAAIGEGTVVAHSALVQISARIGANCIVNSRALVEHDCRIGDHVHLSTGSILNGGATVGDRTLVGSGAIVNHGIRICADAVIGSGSVVVRNLMEPGTYVGVPARRLQNAK